MVEIKVDIPEATWKQLERLAVLRSASISEILARAMRNYMERGRTDAKQ